MNLFVFFFPDFCRSYVSGSFADKVTRETFWSTSVECAESISGFHRDQSEVQTKNISIVKLEAVETSHEDKISPGTMKINKYHCRGFWHLNEY